MKIDIPTDCTKIHILLSGGMDSAILLYLLSKENILSGRNLPIKCYTMSPNKSLLVTNRVLKWFNDRDIFVKHQRFGKRGYIIKFVVDTILLLERGYVYTGCNKVLVDEFTPTVYIEGDTPPARGSAHSEYHIRPFIDMDKSQIMDIYIKENILDLLKLTNSCGALIGGKTQCGGCYFCMERAWAAKKLNLTDTPLPIEE
jgi:hypothetical protein